MPLALMRLTMVLTGSVAKYAVSPSSRSGGVEWLLAVVVGDAGFGQIDRDLLHGHGRTASGLTDAQHVIGLLAFDGLLDHHGAAREHGRNLQFDDAHARDGLGQQLDRFECGIDRLAAERIESGDQDLAHNGSFA